MGCDIHTFAERRVGNRWEIIDTKMPFDHRSYGMFAFLAGVRNYSAVTPISRPRGLPNDASPKVYEQAEVWDSDAHTHSWLSIAELTDFDYNQEMEDRRVTIGGDGGCTCDPGKGKKMNYRHFLGPFFFAELDRIKELGAERLVFWFDN